jgi:hypothetical protein
MIVKVEAPAVAASESTDILTFGKSFSLASNLKISMKSAHLFCLSGIAFYFSNIRSGARRGLVGIGRAPSGNVSNQYRALQFSSTRTLVLAFVHLSQKIKRGDLE